MTIAKAIQVGEYLPTHNFGYAQDANQRLSGWADNGKTGIAGLRQPGSFDCGTATATSMVLGELLPPSVLRGTIYSGNFGAVLGKTGMVDRIDVRKLTLDQIKAKARPADGIYGPGHVMLHLGGNRWLSFESNEKGKPTGGKIGKQKGELVRVRGLYLRGASSRSAGKSKTGWTELVRPRAAETFMAQVIAAYSKGVSMADAQSRLNLRAPWDGPRIQWLMGQWARLDKGLSLTFRGMSLSVPKTGHAFVVLGSTAAKMKRRLEAGLPYFKSYPGSKILVTGKPIRDGLSESEWMKRWLIANGIPASRILVENKATSTVGNAIHSIRLLLVNKLTTYTLVSDASHLRRAQVEFLAAQVKREIGDNTKRKIAPVGLIAFNDYGSDIKTAKPVSNATRAAVAKEVASLLGISSQYNTAL